MTDKHKLIIGGVVVVLLPLIGGIVGYSQKECPKPDRALYDSLAAENRFLSESAAKAVAIADSLASREPEETPTKIIYKKHALRLTNNASLDTLRGILLRRPEE